jgi:hypothetical protein
VLQPMMMRHGPGLAASPLVRNNLEVGGRGALFLLFSALGGQSLSEAATRTGAPFGAEVGRAANIIDRVRWLCQKGSRHLDVIGVKELITSGLSGVGPPPQLRMIHVFAYLA